jgi:flagellar motor protein MotB
LRCIVDPPELEPYHARWQFRRAGVYNAPTQGGSAMRPALSVSIRLVSVVFSAVIAAGCVSAAKYDQVAKERDVYKRQGEALTRETEQLEVAQGELEADLELLVIAGTIKMSLLRDGLHLVLPHDVLFETGSADLTDSGRKAVEDVGRELSEYPYQVAVLGYTDSQPIGAGLRSRYPSNWELAASRAASVVRVLESSVPSAQLVVVSFGSNRPVAANDTPEGRSENRRIDIRLRPVTAPAEF